MLTSRSPRRFPVPRDADDDEDGDEEEEEPEDDGGDAGAGEAGEGGAEGEMSWLPGAGRQAALWS